MAEEQVVRCRRDGRAGAGSKYAIIQVALGLPSSRHHGTSTNLTG